MTDGIGSRIQELLTEQGITQYKLATDLHLSPNTVGGYVRNRRIPDCIILARIAAYLGTSMDYLLGNTNQKLPRLESLSDDELCLLSHYRQLTPAHQEALTDMAIALSMMDSGCNNKH